MAKAKGVQSTTFSCVGSRSRMKVEGRVIFQRYSILIELGKNDRFIDMACRMQLRIVSGQGQAHRYRSKVNSINASKNMYIIMDILYMGRTYHIAICICCYLSFTKILYIKRANMALRDSLECCAQMSSKPHLS